MKKITISTEISREQLNILAFFTKTEVTAEQWGQLTEKPINVSLEDIDDREAQLGLLCVLLGLAFKEAGL